MKAYSPDLCAKIAQACDEGIVSRRQLARQFRVSVAFIQKMLRRRHLTGTPAATAHTGGRHGLLDAEELALLARLIREQNDLTLAELCERVADEHRVHVSVPTMYRSGRRLRLPVQKKLMHASERDTPRVQAERSHYHKLSATLDPHRLKFIDESGINLAMTRIYGRAPRGERILGSGPQNYAIMLGALSCAGLEAVMTIEGATDSEMFRTYACEVLYPTLRMGDIVFG